MDRIEQGNAVLTSTDTLVMVQLAQLMATMRKMQEQTKKTNMGKNPNRKYYFWICGINLMHGSHSFLNKKPGKNMTIITMK